MLLAHITAPDSVAMMAVFGMGVLTGAAAVWIGGSLLLRR